MPRPPALPAREKTRLVLSVLAKECTVSEAARAARVSEQSIANWRRQFLEGGSAALAGRSAPSSTEQREAALVAEVHKLKQALGEAYVEVMAWRRTGDYRQVPSRSSKQYERN
ncbi:helix-turn-helix domain-containing protein [Streptomyces cellulosae]|jgi:transposase|uniref:Helix-turn-helix domain-containing protein n=2 Tax=Streptomyces TaxID=1883 RepID=A0ABU3J2I5_9ACTN|nr:helix-turn-helix domain-containing protein [Streptomyces sp. McG7]MDQ0485620.1 transposase [Streptomyces thermodiastaticus]MDT6969269.1 helix-turn-helix domain-containing protein [Streptomyces thermocarboxydus]THC55928.1 helix-turn-helix domain-containing protein [Streptomyces sp. Akac8]WSB43261.1 helix-turn-helix domain-containing protein [Streptomyces cellulosae]